MTSPAACACRSGRRARRPTRRRAAWGRTASAMTGADGEAAVVRQVSTSQPSAIVCIHVPQSEIALPEEVTAGSCAMWSERNVVDAMRSASSCHRSSLQLFEQRDRVVERGTLLVGVSARDAARARNTFLRVRLRSSDSRPDVGDRARARCGGRSRRPRAREAGLLESGDDAGHARRLHLLHRRELAQRDRPEVLRWWRARRGGTR